MLELKENGKKPFEFNHIHAIQGEPRSGKNTLTVARVRGYYYRDCVRVYLKERFGIEAIVPSVYDELNKLSGIIVLNYDRYERIAKIVYKGRIRKFKIPDNYNLHSPVRIFANFHLYGMSATYLTVSKIIQGIHDEIIDGRKGDGEVFVLLDQFETIGGNTMEQQTNAGKYFNQEINQFAKKRLEVYALMPSGRDVGRAMRVNPTEIITCRRIAGTYAIEYEIRRRGIVGSIKLKLPDAREYWGNFDTSEGVEVRHGLVEKAIESVKSVKELNATKKNDMRTIIKEVMASQRDG
jgi:hypothetical protein